MDVEIAKKFDDAVKKEHDDHVKWLKENGLYKPPYLLDINITNESYRLRYLNRGPIISPHDVTLYCNHCQCKDIKYLDWLNTFENYLTDCKVCVELNTIICTKCNLTSIIENVETVFKICSLCEHKYIPTIDDFNLKPSNSVSDLFLRTTVTCKGHWFNDCCLTLTCYDCNNVADITDEFDEKHCCCK